MKNIVLKYRLAIRIPLMVLLLSVVSSVRAAYDFSVECSTGQTLYYKITDVNNYYVALTCPGPANEDDCWTNYPEPVGDIVLPESVSYNGISYTVTSINKYAFYGCKNMTGSLIIPDSVTTIGSCAFSGCRGFTGSLIIGNQVTTIAYEAFYCCIGFTGDLIIPNSVTSIGSYAFEDCNGFSGSLILSNSVTEIQKESFYGCSGFIGTLIIPNSVIAIGKAAFFGCSGFTGSLIIPDSVIGIQDGAFGRCSGFNSLVLSNSLVNIGEEVFSHCSGLTGDLIIPNSVKTIGYHAFWDCTGLNGNLVLSNSLTSIGGGAFCGCSGLTGDLIIPNSVTSIEGVAFAHCTSLTSIVMPASVTSIGYSAFSSCTGLTEITMLGTVVPSLLGDSFYDTNNCPIYVPYESLNNYKTANYWNWHVSRIYPMVYTAVSGYGEGEGKWAFIATPLTENTEPTAVSNMVGSAYDLYRFDQSEEAEWQNYIANIFQLVNGQGYLYANKDDVNLIFKGDFNEDETKEFVLVYDANKPFAGWNLLGNPFPVNAYANRSYYVMNEDGTVIEPVSVSMETAIPPSTGIMVKAEAIGQSVTFTRELRQAFNTGNLQIAVIQNNMCNNTMMDKVVVNFNEGDELGKFVFNKDNAKLYIPKGGRNYAIVCAEKKGEISLNFEAVEDGNYTIIVNPGDTEMGYLHLIDNLKDGDIDLLTTPVYTFESKTSDFASRFRLVYNVGH